MSDSAVVARPRAAAAGAASPAATPRRRRGPLTALARALVLRRLRAARLPIAIVDGDGVALAPVGDGPVTVRIHDPRTWRSLAFDGGDGGGTAYGEGWWDCDDLAALAAILARASGAMDRVAGGAGRLAMPLHRLAGLLRRNTRAGARANIGAHYDLGNAFFARWLDPSLTYSSALWAPGDDLAAAQARKIEAVLDALDLRPGMRVLEIGSGWGELAARAARRGARVTTITISREQHAHVVARIARDGLADLVDCRFQDWRDVAGRFDRVVSVEMIEAIGAAAFPAFFARVAAALADDGLAVLQSITIRDQRFAAAARDQDFIKRRIFPGCCLPSATALLTAATAASDLALVAYRDFAAHYARTLAEWRRRFIAAAPDLERGGYDARFRRSWEYYLAYCEGGFAERLLGVAHLTLAKPGWRAVDHARLIAARDDDAGMRPESPQRDGAALGRALAGVRPSADRSATVPR